MVTPSAGTVVLVRFPFSDLSGNKVRPAVVLADAGLGDWAMCQMTSNPYGDSRAVEIQTTDLTSGSLHRTSYARPGKLFTASERLIYSDVGKLNGPAFQA